MNRINITVRIDTGHTWEEAEQLELINTRLYKEVKDKVVILYVEYEDDLKIIHREIQKVLEGAERIRRMTA